MQEQVIAIAAHRSEYPEPITFTAGTVLQVGEHYAENAQWKNWYFCTTAEGAGGWVPEQVFQRASDPALAVALQDYTARELDIDVGERLIATREMNGWKWCQKQSDGESGWLPMAVLAAVEPSLAPARSHHAVHIRLMQAEDIAQWARMREQLWQSQSLREHTDEITHSLSDAKSRNYIAIAEKTLAVGFAEVHLRDYANGCTQQPVPFLEGIWVAPDYQQQGIGKAMIEMIAADLGQAGYQELCSDADIAHVHSHTAHRQWGFVETERVVYFRKPLQA